MDSLLFTNSTPVLGNSPGMNYPSWSISAEMISYLIFGTVVLLFPKYKSYVFGLILLFTVSMLFSTGFYRQTSQWGFLRGLTCFITGIYVYKLYARVCYKTISKYYELAVILIVSVYIFFISKIPNQPIVMLVPIFFGIMLFVLAFGKGLVSTTLRCRPVLWLGSISYSIYLNHAVVLIVYSKLIFKVAAVPVNDLTLFVSIPPYLAIILIYSYFTHRFVENKGKLILSRFMS